MFHVTQPPTVDKYGHLAKHEGDICNESQDVSHLPTTGDTGNTWCFVQHIRIAGPTLPVHTRFDVTIVNDSRLVAIEAPTEVVTTWVTRDNHWLNRPSTKSRES
jgi:hypothetical protein